MVNTEVGRLIEAGQGRDAIHIAVAPVIAVERLSPGQPIGFVKEGDTENVGANCVHLGIVDPFLKAPVFLGDRFFMFLFPNTITSLRHEWVHPAFGEDSRVTPEYDSNAFIAAIAKQCGVTYDRLIAIATNFALSGDYTYDNSETYKDVDWAKWPEFWKHFERLVPEVKVEDSDKESCPFTCSC